MFSGHLKNNQYIELFHSYTEKGLDSPAFSMLKMACTTAETENEINKTAKLLNENIFMSNNIEEVVTCVTDIIGPLIKAKDEKPVLVFHHYGWMYGGAERSLTSIMNYLTQKFTVFLTVFEPVVNTDFQLDPRIRVIPIYGGSQKIARLIKFISLIRPDIFIGNNNSIPEFVQIYPHFLVEGIKTIAYNHEYYFFSHNHDQLFTTVIDKSNALSTATVATFLTSFSANVYGLNFDNGAIMNNPNTFPVYEKYNFSEQGKKVLAVGRFFDPIKRLDRLLKAFSIVVRSYPDAKLIIVGPYDLDARIPRTSEETIQEMLESLAFKEGQVEFVGEQKDTSLFYKESDVLVMTSDNEGFALVLTEAASFGLPSVIFSIPGLEEIVIDGQNGFIVPQDDIIGMARRISELLDNTELRKSMSLKAKELACRFTIEEVGTRWDRLIQLILTSDTQEKVNQQLKNNFMDEVVDYGAFLQHLGNEYEKLSAKLSTVAKLS